MHANPLIHMPFANVWRNNASVAVIILGAYMLLLVLFLAFVSAYS